MNTHLVIAIGQSEDELAREGQRIVNDGMRNFMYPLAAVGHTLSIDEWSPKKMGGWTCAEEDLESVVSYLTKNWPGVDVCVYSLQSIHFREVSEEVKTKEVSKNGVLPA